MKQILLLIYFFHISSAFAWPPELAPELNFTNDKIGDAWLDQADHSDTENKANLFYQKEFKNTVLKKCASCRATEMLDKYGKRKYRITVRGGWYFDITLDPAVVEITSKPILVTDLPKMQKKMNQLIWDTAKEVRLNVDKRGAGHLNYGITSTFDDDALKFYNFFTDYLNHSELANGILGYKDIANAPHPESLSAEQRKAMKSVLNRFNEKKDSIRDLAKRIHKKVYYKSTTFGGADGEPPEKYHSLNVSSLVNEGDSWPRLELRAIGMQENAEKLILLNELFMGRMKYLEGKTEKIPYVADKTFTVSGEKMLEGFYQYVTEAGLDWNKFRALVGEGYEAKLKLFEEKLAKENSSSCASHFKKMN